MTISDFGHEGLNIRTFDPHISKLLQPDLVITKPRDASGNWYAFDSVRGATIQMEFGDDGVETTVAQSLKSFDSDGFTLGTDTGVNTNTVKYMMRRRLGGQCAEPWRFKLQYVSA